METLHFMGETIQYRVVKSKRKTVTITVRPKEIIVRTPLNLSNQTVKELVMKKASWIIKKRSEMKNRENTDIDRTIESGKVIYFRGSKKTLNLQKQYGICSNVEMTETHLHIVFDPLQEEPKEILEHWLRKEAGERITKRVLYYQSMYEFGKVPNRICIKDQKTRWGSCSSKNNLNFNYRLILAPDSVLDYVVVHELCHLKYMNHSKEFWNFVASIMPDYRKHQEWLRIYGNQLYLQ